MFEDLDAVLTPIGGRTIALIQPAHLARATISVTLGAFLKARLVRPIRECIWRPERAWEGSVGRCLSIVKLSWHHPVVTRSLIHRSDPPAWPRATISVTLGGRCLPEPCGACCVQSENASGWRPARVGAAGWLVFEHREAVLTPPGGGTIAHSLIRPAHLAPCHNIRYSRCLPEPSSACCVQPENASGGLHVWERPAGWCLSIVKLS